MATNTKAFIGLNTVTELAKQSSVDDCFQSVSEGKSLIASAITDKGVSTSSTATFQTMANNISSISQLDTSDATATGGQILSGYTAYARGQKIIGTMQSGDVLNGLRGVYQRVDVDSWNNTAYVNTSGAPQIVVISDNLWERNLGHVVVAYGDGAQNWQVTFEANRVKLYWPETWGWKNCLICVFYK